MFKYEIKLIYIVSKIFPHKCKKILKKNNLIYNYKLIGY